MQLRIFTEPRRGAAYDQLLAVARAAERGVCRIGGRTRLAEERIVDNQTEES
jgi:hypothetical protein